MDAKRLEEIAHFLFPDAGRSWKGRLAHQMGTHVTTVRRWANGGKIPPFADKALECLAARKNDILKAQHGGN